MVGVWRARFRGVFQVFFGFFGIFLARFGIFWFFWVLSGFFFGFLVRVGFFMGSWFPFRFSWVFNGVFGFRACFLGCFSGLVRVFSWFSWVFAGFVLWLLGFLVSLGFCVFSGFSKRIRKRVAGEPIIGAFLPMG